MSAETLAAAFEAALVRTQTRTRALWSATPAQAVGALFVRAGELVALPEEPDYTAEAEALAERLGIRLGDGVSGADLTLLGMIEVGLVAAVDQLRA